MSGVQQQLRDLIALADEFLAGFPHAEPGDEEGTEAVESYVRSRTVLFDSIVAAGGPTQDDRALVETLLAHDEKIRGLLTQGTTQARGRIGTLRNGRRALRGYRAETGARRPVSVKG
jgi:hypothetical protein